MKSEKKSNPLQWSYQNSTTIALADQVSDSETTRLLSISNQKQVIVFSIIYEDNLIIYNWSMIISVLKLTANIK